jgi:hypothetical protein
MAPMENGERTSDVGSCWRVPDDVILSDPDTRAK